MWPDSRSDPATVFLHVGGGQLDWGVWHGRWDALGSAQLDTSRSAESQTPLDVLKVALDRLQGEADRLRGAMATQVVAHGWALRVLVSDIWLAEDTIPWGDEMLVDEDSKSLAREVLASAGHRLDVLDPIALDDAPAGVPRLAVSLPEVLLDALQALATSFRARLSSVLPVSAAAWALFRSAPNSSGAALAIADACAWSLVHGQGRIAGVSSRWVDAGTSLPGYVELIAGTWRRSVSRNPALATVQPLRLLFLDRAAIDEVVFSGDGHTWHVVQPPGDATVPAVLRVALESRHASSALDLFRSVSAPSAAGVLAGLCAIGLAVAFVVLAWNAGEATNQLGKHRDALQASSRTQRPVEKWTGGEVPRVRAINAAISELNLPAFAVLSALIPPKDISVYVLTADLSGQSKGAEALAGNHVKITALASTPEDMTRYVAFVSDRRPFVATYLLHHEMVAKTSDSPYRFTLDAAWPQ